MAIGVAVLAPAAQAAFPGRNGLIAYASPGAGEEGGPSEIWTVDPSSGATTQLTNLFDAREPAWSDDGRTLAFSEFVGRQGDIIGAVPWRRPTAGPWQLQDVEFMTAPPLPTGPDDVGTAEDSNPAWAPGGRRIAYVDKTESLAVLGADDSKRVIASGANADGPAWSPDGRLIAFTRCGVAHSGCSIWLVRPNGTHLRRLTDGTMDEQNPSWSPNGRRLVFEADGGLWTIRRPEFGRRPRPRPLVASGVGPSWSPDGKQIAYGGADGLYVVNADGSDARRVVATPTGESDRAAFAALNADPEVMRHFPAPMSREESDALVDVIAAGMERDGWGWWALELKSTGAFIGFTGLGRPTFEAHFMPAVEIGWRLAREAWGHGYATEAARAAARYGFEVLGCDELVAFTAAGNVRSRAVMERLGMTHDTAGDFDHPRVPEGSPVRRHVLYRLRASRRAGPGARRASPAHR